MKKIFLFLLLFTLNHVPVWAQNSGSLDLVSIKIVSTGKTEASALTEALRSALIQTSAVFISANTTIINDQIAKDEISLINNGSIVSYKIIDKIENIDGSVSLTYDITVSVNSLTSFVENSGGSAELKGGLFAANIKQQELNEKAEETALKNLILVSQNILKRSFDYKIETAGDPKDKNGIWAIPLLITINKNKNYDSFVKYFSNSLREIAMKKNDYDSYLKLNKQLYAIGLFDNSTISSSTPIVDIRSNSKIKLAGTPAEIPKDIDYIFYSPYDYSVLANNKKEMETKMILEGARKNAYAVPRQLPDYALTETKTGTFSMFYLRSKGSINLLHDFIYNIAGNLVDFNINNGFTSYYLLDIEHNGSRNHGRSNGSYFSVGWLTNLPIALTRNYNYDCILSGGHFFYHDLKENRKFISYDLFDRGTNKPSFVKNDRLLPNTIWQSKCLGNEYIGCFDYIFGNYIRYLKAVSEVNLIYSSNKSDKKLISIPIQLTLVGNESNQVCAIALENNVSTEQVSKISEYKIERPKD